MCLLTPEIKKKNLSLNLELGYNGKPRTLDLGEVIVLWICLRLTVRQENFYIRTLPKGFQSIESKREPKECVGSAAPTVSTAACRSEEPTTKASPCLAGFKLCRRQPGTSL